MASSAIAVTVHANVFAAHWCGQISAPAQSTMKCKNQITKAMTFGRPLVRFVVFTGRPMETSEAKPSRLRPPVPQT